MHVNFKKKKLSIGNPRWQPSQDIALGSYGKV
jgi:hypothetical protein